jgi:hypothetical protein
MSEFEGRLTLNLRIMMKAEEELKKELRKIVKQAFIGRIEKGEGGLVEKGIEIAFTLPVVIFPTSSLARDAARVTLNQKDKDKAKLMSEYRQIEAHIDNMDGQKLYEIFKKLKHGVALKTIFKNIRESGRVFRYRAYKKLTPVRKEWNDVADSIIGIEEVRG